MNTYNENQIEKLLLFLRNKKFEEFLKCISELNINTQNSIKLELIRLSSISDIIIDMRDNPMGDSCIMKTLNNNNHFIHKDALADLDRQLYLYNGKYTVGVFEHLKKWQSDKYSSSIKAFDAKLIKLNESYTRQHKRIYFTTPITILTKHGEKITANTYDLSIGGMMASLEYNPRYEKGDIFSIFFHSLYREFRHPALALGINYQVIEEVKNGNKTWLRLKNIGRNPDFDNFLDNIICMNKIRYRVNVNDLILSEYTKIHSDLYLREMTGVPLFLGKDSESPIIIALRNAHNKHIIEAWRNDDGEYIPHHLFTPSRLKMLCKSSLTEEFIYCFTHADNLKKNFFSATASELSDLSIKNAFFYLGSQCTNWRAYKLMVSPCFLDGENKIDILGGKHHEDFSALQACNIRYIACLQDITIAKDNIVFEENKELEKVKLLQHFISKEHPFRLKIFNISNFNTRRELRYEHRTLVTVNTAHDKFTGWTNNISYSGIQITIDTIFTGNVGDTVMISFDHLQKLSKNHDLQKISYRVVRLCPATKKTIHLVVDGEKKAHRGYIFLKMLIDNNKEKLLSDSETTQKEGLIKSLQKIYLKHIFTPHLYIKKHHSDEPLLIVNSNVNHNTLSIFNGYSNEKELLNLHPILQGSIFDEAISTPLRQPPHHICIEVFVYKTASFNTTSNSLFKARLANSFKSLDEQKTFVEDILKNGVFYSYILQTKRASPIKIAISETELADVALNAKHKGKCLKDEFEHIVGTTEIIETTQSTLTKLSIPTTFN